MNIKWTKHAKDRQKEWEKKLKISCQEIEALVENPSQIVPGDRNVLVAQGRRKNGLLRVPFIEVGINRKILTVYWTSKVEKYWGKGNEDTV